MKFCVSLTTLPSRISNIEETLISIKNQTIQPKNIFLNLPLKFRRFKDYSFKDEDIEKLEKYDLKIKRCDDYGPATKLMGSLNEIKDDYQCVILLDDDHIYHKKTLEIFINNFKINPINYSFYSNKVFDIKIGQCADGFLINCKNLDQIHSFYEKYVKENKNLFHDDDIWFALYLYLEKNTKIDNLIKEFQKETNQKVVYEQHINKDIDALHQTIHKSGFFLNRRKIQKIEYIKYKMKKFFKF